MLTHAKKYLNDYDKYNLFIKISEFIVSLNIKFGFCHYDLHSDNLLININKMKFKIFDFDLSRTNKNPNVEYFERFDLDKKYINNAVNYGLCYDIFRLFSSIGISTPVQRKANLIDFTTHRYNKLIDKMDLYYIEYSKLLNKNVKPFGFIIYQIIFKQMYDDKFVIFIKQVLNKNKKGGYYEKYQKYKQKYIKLKSETNIQ